MNEKKVMLAKKKTFDGGEKKLSCIKQNKNKQKKEIHLFSDSDIETIYFYPFSQE